MEPLTSMTAIFTIYLILYAGIVLSNCLYWLLMKQKLALVLYAFATGSYLIFIGIAFFTPLLRECLSIYNVPIMLIILAVDFHSTLKWRSLDIKTVFPYMDENLAALARKYSVVEWAKAVPALISAPLYIVGLLLVIELVKSHIAND